MTNNKLKKFLRKSIFRNSNARVTEARGILISSWEMIFYADSWQKIRANEFTKIIIKKINVPKSCSKIEEIKRDRKLFFK